MTTRICARFSTPFPLGSCPPLPQPAPRGTWLAAAILGQAAPPLRPPTWRRPALSPPSGTGPCWPAKAEGALSWAKILLGEKKTPVNGGARGSLMGFSERWHGLRAVSRCSGTGRLGGVRREGSGRRPPLLSPVKDSRLFFLTEVHKIVVILLPVYKYFPVYEFLLWGGRRSTATFEPTSPVEQQHLVSCWTLFHKTQCYTQKTDQTHPVYPTQSWDPKTWHRAITQNCNVVSAHRGHRCRQRWSNDL